MSSSSSSSSSSTLDPYRSHLGGQGEERTSWRHGAPPNYDLVNHLFQTTCTKVWLFHRRLIHSFTEHSVSIPYRPNVLSHCVFVNLFFLFIWLIFNLLHMGWYSSHSHTFYPNLIFWLDMAPRLFGGDCTKSCEDLGDGTLPQDLRQWLQDHSSWQVSILGERWDQFWLQVYNIDD